MHKSAMIILIYERKYSIVLINSYKRFIDIDSIGLLEPTLFLVWLFFCVGSVTSQYLARRESKKIGRVAATILGGLAAEKPAFSAQKFR